MEQRVAGTISHGTATMSLTTLAVVVALPAKGALVNLTLLCARERHSVVFELFGRASGIGINDEMIIKKITNIN